MKNYILFLTMACTGVVFGVTGLTRNLLARLNQQVPPGKEPATPCLNLEPVTPK